ncbi:ABC transporter ATP-binding protein [Pantoea allii]|uniref:ABC transporter ATP-binding protein n=1 Tax=Pantoea allii TaxID=574096 RepID=UPI001F4EBFC1|nr:ABC transporter ATP-binding protein [Pantoea allii]MCH9298033.1 ABC transporter ATP-binding protein [Pantoea allii]
MCSEYSLIIDDISKQYKMYASPKHRFLDLFSNGALGKNTVFYALKNFSLKVKKGESIGILGKNGAGKSTLLQILAGIIPPSSGSVTVNGNVSALLELGAGFNPEFSGRENIEISATIYGVRLTEEKIKSIIDFADIGNFIDQPVKVYSSGMFIRLAFAIASQMEPDILIVDEALSVGDLQFQTKCLRLIEKLREQGCTFVFVSHSPRMVELFCDRAIWLQDGKVKLDGEPKKVVRAYENFMVGGLDSDAAASTVIIQNDVNSYNDGFIKITSSHHVEAKAGFSIDSVRVNIDGEYNPNLIVSKTANLIVEACFTLAHSVNKPLWAVGLFNELNQPVFHYNTDNSGVVFKNSDYSELTGTIRFSLELPSIRPGEYLIAIGLDDGVPGTSEVLVHLYDSFKIRVTSSNESPQAGYIQINNCMAEILNAK